MVRLAAVVVALACGGMAQSQEAQGAGASDGSWQIDEAQAPDLRPIEAILSEPLDLSDLSSASATLRVITTEDVACVVVFGESESFGQMAFDQDMAQSAHREHRVVMRGLKPETQYFYRMQGSDPQGNLYVSEIHSFRTPASEEGALLGGAVNLATVERGAEVLEVSSTFGSSGGAGPWGASNAIDGDPTTEWSSQGDGDAAFLVVQLAEPATIRGFGLWTRTMGSSAQIERFQVTNENGEVFGPYEVEDADQLHAYPAEGEGQRFTFEVLSSSGGNTGAVEVAVFAVEE